MGALMDPDEVAASGAELDQLLAIDQVVRLCLQHALAVPASIITMPGDPQIHVQVHGRAATEAWAEQLGVPAPEWREEAADGIRLADTRWPAGTFDGRPFRLRGHVTEVDGVEVRSS